MSKKEAEVAPTNSSSELWIRNVPPHHELHHRGAPQVPAQPIISTLHSAALQGGMGRGPEDM